MQPPDHGSHDASRGIAPDVPSTVDTGTPATRLLAGRYQLHERLATGGTAQVHAATDIVLDRRVAVKLLDADAVDASRPGSRERFRREARTMARFTHPDAVTVYDAGEDAGQLFLVLELVDGPSLSSRLGDGPLPVDEAVRIATHVLRALAAAHAAGIVHRDVKPGNVLLGRNGVVKLADFGIARRFDDLEDDLTAVGTVVGTPRYLAPEQAVGEAVTPATDVHAVGLLLHEMLTGRATFEAPTGALVVAAITGATPSDVREARRDVSPALAQVVARALAKDPADRWRSAADMAAALERARRQPERVEPTAVLPVAEAPPRAPDQRRTPRWLVPAVVAVLVAAGIAGVALGNDPVDEVVAQPTVTTAPAAGATPTDSATVPATTAAPTAPQSTAPTTPPATAVPEIVPGFPETQDLDTFLRQLQANPAVAGTAGPVLAEELAAVLERNGRRREERAQALAADVEEWVDSGELDPTLAAALVALLDVAPRGDGGGGDGDDD
jgi:tRNA A-37 threonylcarbamoyl transferase component Bud32